MWRRPLPIVFLLSLGLAPVVWPPSLLRSAVGASVVDPSPAQAPAWSRACEIPILWRIAEVDTRFGISEDDASRAIRQAGMLWEEALDQVLMFQESTQGIPVRFVYDERQQSTQERQARLASIQELYDRITAAETELETLRAYLARRRIVHQARVSSYEERSASHAELVAYWNQQGGAPLEEVQRLRAVEEELQSARESANEAGDEVNALVQEINDETELLNQQIAAANQARDELEREFPHVAVQSGQYIDSRRGIGRLTFSREIEIRIFHFEDRDHLVMVIAHELGHALGLEHNGVEGALMAETSVAAPGQGVPRIHPADVDALSALCPEL